MNIKILASPFRLLLEDRAEAFPGCLAGGTRAEMPRRRTLLAVLMLVCLIPRVWAAWNWNVLWADTVFYLDISNALERRAFPAAFFSLGLNVYPVILLWLRHCGVDWTVAGEWWSIAMATLAVLPLYGWVRRQFDDQVAAVACLLYALHPKLVAFSPLIIRDPTFWLLLNLTLYLILRAAVEIRWSLFLAAGVALTLSVHTRTEGWVLLVPVVLWPALRLPSAAGSRVRLVVGTLACLAVIPLSVALVNATWLRDCPQWSMIRGHHLAVVHRWLGSFSTSAPPTTPESTPADELSLTPTLDPLEKRHSGFPLVRKLAVRLVKAFTYVPGVLVLIGVWQWRHVFFRLDHLVVSFMSLLLLVAIGIRYSEADTDIRYFLPIVFVSFPAMGLGLLQVTDGIVRATGRRVTWGPKGRCALAVGLLAIVWLAGWRDRELSAGPRMHQRAALGRQILQRLGPNRSIAARLVSAGPVVYYSRGRLVGEPLLSVLGDHRPVVVLLEDSSQNRDCWAAYAAILQRELGLRYHRIPEDRLPPRSEGTLVLVRSDERF